MKTEIQYRTFDELLDAVRIDIPTHDLEGVIEPAQLIKIAAKVSYQLGLKINPSRSKMITLDKGKARLPADFDVLNFALLCGDRLDNNNYFGKFPQYKTYCQGVMDGVELAEDSIHATMVKLYSEIIDLQLGANLIVHNLCSRDFVVQAFTPAGELLDFNVAILDEDRIEIISEVPNTLENIKIVLVGGGATSQSLTSIFAELNLCEPGTVTPSCNDTCVEVCTECDTPAVNVCDKNGNEIYRYQTLIPLNIVKTKTTSADPFNIMPSSHLSLMLKNNFIVCNFEEGEIYLNYQSLMEDDEGNLLVMSHPLVDEYYEYAIKLRIFENLVLSGDQSAVPKFQLAESRYREARFQAMTLVNTPDFAEMKRVWIANRKAMYSKYYDMFKRYPVTKSTF